MIKTYIDIDGVVRDLARSVFGKKPVLSWDQPAPGGMEFFQYVAYKGLQVVDTAEPTRFYKAVHKFFTENPQHRLTFLTHQHEAWKPYTEKWLERYFCETDYEILYVEKMMDKVQYLSGAVLIDDYPGFIGTKNVLCVDQSYNRRFADNRPPHIRIKTAKDMTKVLTYLHSEVTCLPQLYMDLALLIDGGIPCSQKR